MGGIFCFVSLVPRSEIEKESFKKILKESYYLPLSRSKVTNSLPRAGKGCPKDREGAFRKFFKKKSHYCTLLHAKS